MINRSLCQEPSEFLSSTFEDVVHVVEQSKRPFYVTKDNFKNMNDVTKAITEADLNDCGLIFGIEYTISNRLQGQKTFGSRSLHNISEPQMNPYQQVICLLGETLEKLNVDGRTPAFGFSDSKTKQKSIFPLKVESMCKGFNEVLEGFNKITPGVQLSGPSSFVPLIEEAMKIVKQTKGVTSLTVGSNIHFVDKFPHKK